MVRRLSLNLSAFAGELSIRNVSAQICQELKPNFLVADRKRKRDTWVVMGKPAFLPLFWVPSESDANLQMCYQPCLYIPCAQLRTSCGLFYMWPHWLTPEACACSIYFERILADSPSCGYGLCACPSHHSAGFNGDMRGASEDHCPLCSSCHHACAWHIEPLPDHGQGVFHFLVLGICPQNIS